MNNRPTKYDDIIDSRDVDEAIEELRYASRLDKDEKDYLYSLYSLRREARDYCADWDYGESLVRDSYFTQYAKELAEDIGAVDSNVNSSNWPLYCIDWDQAAHDLKMDYTAVEFDDVTYWTR